MDCENGTSGRTISTNSDGTNEINVLSDSSMDSDAIPSGGSSCSSKLAASNSSSSTGTNSPVKLGTGTSRNAILVNPRQRGNPVLRFIRNVAWEYSEIVPDYIMGSSICALFLSIRYHNLHPNYVYDRIQELKGAFGLRILLVQIDVPDPFPILKGLTHLGLLADLTVLTANSPEDAGKILENYKIYENKPPDIIQEKQDPNIVHQVVDALCSIRAVNRTDAMILLHNFGSLEGILKASLDQLVMCPGFGNHKAKKCFDAIHDTFKSTNTKL